MKAKYLRNMDHRVDNAPFKNHSWYSRNALMRANYEDVTRGIAPTAAHLELFFDNLLHDAHHELRNRYLHLDWSQEEAGQGELHMPNVSDQVADQVIDQVKALLGALGNGELSATELMGMLGLSHRHTFRQNYLNSALEAGLIERTIPEKPTSRLQKYRKTGR